jgi:hypothetical protein
MVDLPLANWITFAIAWLCMTVIGVLARTYFGPFDPDEGP